MNKRIDNSGAAYLTHAASYDGIRDYGIRDSYTVIGGSVPALLYVSHIKLI